MSLSHVFETIENRLTELCLKNIWGGELKGAECVGIVHRADPEAWSAAEDLLESGQITPEEYKNRIFEVISQFERQSLRLRLEGILSKRATEKEKVNGDMQSL